MTDFSYSEKQKGNVVGGSSRPGAVVGIEIGYSSIHMVRLRKAPDGQIFFEECHTVEFDPKLDLASSAFASVLRPELKRFCGSSKDLEIWAAPKLDRARLHHIKIPRVSSNRLPGAVYWGLQREDPFLEKETVVDFQIEEGAPSGGTLNITGALIERNGIEDLQQAFSQAGYPLTGTGLPLFALRNLVNLRGDSNHEVPALVCQLGQLATTVSFLIGQRLVFTRNIPMGLQNLAETLVRDLNPTPSDEEAFDLILKLGLENGTLSPEESQQHETAFSLLRPVLARAVRQIERTREYYQSNFDTEPIETIFLGGGIAARGRLFDFISEQLSSEVIAIDPFETRELKSKISFPKDRGDRIAFGPAFGLALEAGQDGINLGHPFRERQNESKYRKIETAASALMMLLAVAAVLFYNWQRLQLKSLNAERSEVEESLNAKGPQLTEAIITKATQDVQALQERRKAASRRYESLALLSEITRLTPKQVTLLHASAAMGRAITFFDVAAEENSPIKASAKNKGTLVLKGIVSGERTSLETSLTIYIARLGQSNLFRNVEVDSTELVETPDELLLTFTLNVKTVEEIEEEITKNS